MALHVGQQRLETRLREAAAGAAVAADGPGASGEFVIWDVGLGPAGNAVAALETLKGLTAQMAQTGGRVSVALHSFEVSTAILEFALRHAPALGDLAGWEHAITELLATGACAPLPHVRWQLHRGPFASCLGAVPPPAAVFHDPYSPPKNPDMWSVELFHAMRARTLEPGAPPCLLTCYSRSTAIRVTLALAGWFVGVGLPTGEKAETTVAASRMELLEKPLGGDWLRRVRASTNAAPLRGGVYAPGPIAAGDLERLEALPQFLDSREDAKARRMGEEPAWGIPGAKPQS